MATDVCEETIARSAVYIYLRGLISNRVTRQYGQIYTQVQCQVARRSILYLFSIVRLSTWRPLTRSGFEGWKDSRYALSRALAP